jgi:hypothetical protein
MRAAVDAPNDSDVSTPNHAKAYPSEFSTVSYYQELPANEKETLV